MITLIEPGRNPKLLIWGLWPVNTRLLVIFCIPCILYARRMYPMQFWEANCQWALKQLHGCLDPSTLCQRQRVEEYGLYVGWQRLTSTLHYCTGERTLFSIFSPLSIWTASLLTPKAISMDIMTTDDEHFLTDSQRPRDCKTREGPNNIFSESCLAISLQ